MLSFLSPRTVRRIALFSVACMPVLGAGAAFAASGTHSIHHSATTRRGAPLSRRDQTIQVLDRFSFGPTPGMVQTVTAEGWQKWFAQQLHPESIPDPILEKRLADLPSLQMTPAQIAVAFPDGQVIRRIAMGKEAMPQNPRLAAAYQVMLARYQQREAMDKADAAGAPKGSTAASASIPVPPVDPAASKAELKNQEQERAGQLAGPILALPAGQRLDAVLALPVPDRMALTRGLPRPMQNVMLQGLAPRDRELWEMMAGGYGANGVAAKELQQAKMLRAILSQRQLQEVMTDFWVNHFNIDLGKSGDEILYANQFEQQVIRPHALGKFRDLLLATAHSPAMMIYLDNVTSVGPDSPAALRQAKNGHPLGLNENYGREVMELHTVGVNGGYTQTDVTTLSKILTGWTIDKQQQGGPFMFNPRRHEPGNQQWMGHTIQDNGEQGGVQALTWLADSPATARHISTELAERFVSDTPPPALVDRIVAAWESSDGDIATVLQAMVRSPEFFSRPDFRTKVKSPLEYVASAMRATDTPPTNPAALVAAVQLMGEPLYRCLPPTGYPVTGAQWMNSGALIDRLNFAMALANGKLGGMHLDAPLLVANGVMDAPSSPGRGARNVAFVTSGPQNGADPGAYPGEDRSLDLMERAVVAGEMTQQTNTVIEHQLSTRDTGAEDANSTVALDTMAAMILGSPEFQMH
jgi:uncharacterized protein (DUF1800 family)